MEREAKSTEREFGKKVGSNAKSKRPKAKWGLGKLQRKTVYWDLPRCLKTITIGKKMLAYFIPWF